MFRTKCGSPADKILRHLGVRHDVTLEAADWKDAAALFVVQQRIAFDRSDGELHPDLLEAFVELLMRAQIRRDAKEAADEIAQLLAPGITHKQAEAQIRALCAAGYITEEDVDEIVIKE